MQVTIDASYQSLNKHNEELCGDKVEIFHTPEACILILADGMGSGVKANILATLTSKILGTMLLNGAEIDECVETIVKTLPLCQIRQVAYSTFSILQISHGGAAYLIEFDNPSCIHIRENRLVPIPYEARSIEGKTIRESRFQVQLKDALILVSDGAVHAGAGNLLNFGWTWENLANYALSVSLHATSASRMCALLIKACDELYMKLPGDDTTIAAVKINAPQVVNLLTGPPLNSEDDSRLIKEFMKHQGKRIISGGTSAQIAARILDRPLKTSLTYTDPSLPPMAEMAGIDLVTEGVLTLSRALSLIKSYSDGKADEAFFNLLDQENGGSKIARLLIEDCTTLNLFVGRAINEAHQNPGLPFDLSIRMHLVAQLEKYLQSLGKAVTVTYY